MKCCFIQLFIRVFTVCHSTWFCWIWFFTSLEAIFQLFWDGPSWVEPVLSMDKYVLLKDTTQWLRWGLNPQPLGLESSTLPLGPLIVPDWPFYMSLIWMTCFLYKRLWWYQAYISSNKDPIQSVSNIKQSGHAQHFSLWWWLAYMASNDHPDQTVLRSSPIRFDTNSGKPVPVLRNIITSVVHKVNSFFDRF